MENIEICNIWKQQCKITIRKKERLCPKCNGRGAEFLNASFKTRKFEVRECVLCRGEGKVDWITAITQKPQSKSTGFPFNQEIKEIHIKCSGPNRCKKRLKRMWLERKRFVDPYGPFVYKY